MVRLSKYDGSLKGGSQIEVVQPVFPSPNVNMNRLLI